MSLERNSNKSHVVLMEDAMLSGSLQPRQQHNKRHRTILWIGGTSGLAQTYWNAYNNNYDRDCHRDTTAHDDNNGFVDEMTFEDRNHYYDTVSIAEEEQESVDWIIMGLECIRPSWLPSDAKYRHCDLSTLCRSNQASSSTEREKRTSSHQQQQQQQQQDLLEWFKQQGRVDQIVLSVRPALMTPRTHERAWQYAADMLQGLEWVLHHCCCPPLSAYKHVRQEPFPQSILNISSIAAIHHCQKQHLHNERHPDSYPPSESLENPYDRFKRACEETIETLPIRNSNRETNHHQLKTNDAIASRGVAMTTHLRLGAFFADSTTCIQCQALAWQCRTGPYLTVPIDCNSGRNVAHLIHAILERQWLYLERTSINVYGLQTNQMQDTTCMVQGTAESIQAEPEHTRLRTFYYYTRPLSCNDPVPYGEYLLAYRAAYKIRVILWCPLVVVQALVAVVHVITDWLGSYVPYLHSMDYLLQVTNQEHSFDMSLVETDFGSWLQPREESIQECFTRRRQQFERAQLQQQQFHRRTQRERPKNI